MMGLYKFFCIQTCHLFHCFFKESVSRWGDEHRANKWATSRPAAAKKDLSSCAVFVRMLRRIVRIAEFDFSFLYRRIFAEAQLVGFFLAVRGIRIVQDFK